MRHVAMKAVILKNLLSVIVISAVNLVFGNNGDHGALVLQSAKREPKFDVDKVPKLVLSQRQTVLPVRRTSQTTVQHVQTRY